LRLLFEAFQLIDGSVNARENTLLMDEVQELLSGPFQEKDKRISSSRFCETQSTLQKSTLMELPSSEIYAASIDEKIKVFCKNNDQVSTIINLWEKCSCFGGNNISYIINLKHQTLKNLYLALAL
jgi:hypothetical protein